MRDLNLKLEGKIPITREELFELANQFPSF